MWAEGLAALTAALYEAGRAELQQRLIEVARANPSMAREVTHVNSMLGAGLVDELSAEWCRRLKLPVRAVNRSKVIVVKKEIQGQDGEPLVEIDRVVFDQQIREGAPDGDVWLEVALVHPADLPSEYRCWISTRFALTDKKVCSTIATVQRRWSERFGAHFFEQGEAKPYVYSPRSGKVTRAFGAQTRYRFAGDPGRIYQYLNVIAHAWDWGGADLQANSETVRKSMANAPRLALDLFADASRDARSASGNERPKLTRSLIERVGQALGYVSASGTRRTKGKPRPAHGEIDNRLLPLVAKIMATRHKKDAATLLRTVVRPALLGHAFEGLVFESAERIVRPNHSVQRRAKLSRTPAQKRRGAPRRKKD